MTWERSSAVPYVGPFHAVPYADVFTAEECRRLRQGLLPEVMEDKWAVLFDDPFLYLHRSWTGELAYRLRLETDAEGGRIGEAVATSHVPMVHGPEYEAALVSFLLRGMILRQSVSFPVPAGGAPGPAGLFQHAMTGTAFPEAVPGPRPAGHALPAGRTRWWAVVLSPLAVIAVCAGVQHAAGPFLGAWSWVPTMLAFWAVIAGAIAWARRDQPLGAWFARPRGGAIWSLLAVVVALGAVREFFAGWHTLATPGVFVPWLVFGLVNPWFEESYWRGLLIDAAGRWKVAGVLYSTALFAISHPLVWGVHSVALRSPAALVGLGLVGLVWGVAYARTGSLRFTIAGHACANLLGLSVPVLLNLHVPAGLR